MRGVSGGRQHYNVTFALLATAGIAYALLQSLVAPALPELQHALHTSVNSASWVLTAYLLSASIATPLIGRLGDIHGKERLLVGVLVLLCVGTVTSALATTLTVMLIGRIIQGAAGGLFPLAFGIIRDEFPRERIAAGSGSCRRCSASAAEPASSSPGRSSTISTTTTSSGCRSILLVPATVAIHFFVPESPVRDKGTVNWAGTVLMAIGLAALLVAVSEAPVWGWSSPKTIGLLALGASCSRSGCGARAGRRSRSSTCA